MNKPSTGQIPTREASGAKLSPADFFDLSQEPEKTLFQDMQYVWEGVSALPGFIERNIEPQVNGEVEEGAWLEPGAVQLGAGSRVERGAIVRGPTIIGRNCVVRSGAYIRGHVMLGEECLIGHGVELRQVLGLHNVSISHHSCVFTSLFGNRVWFAGNAQTANHLMTREEVIIRVRHEGKTHAFPTGETLFGAIVGDDSRIGALALLHPGTVIGRNCLIYPQSSVSGYKADGSRVFPRREKETGQPI